MPTEHDPLQQQQHTLSLTNDCVAACTNSHKVMHRCGAAAEVPCHHSNLTWFSLIGLNFCNLLAFLVRVIQQFLQEGGHGVIDLILLWASRLTHCEPAPHVLTRCCRLCRTHKGTAHG